MTVTVSTRRRVSKTALDLPVFGFGTAHLGELYGRVDEAASSATMDAAWEAGVRFYDTAPWYGRGLSEHRLGGFLRTKPRARIPGHHQGRAAPCTGRQTRPPSTARHGPAG